MKKIIFILPLIIILFSNCKKNIHSEDLYVRGRLFLTDITTQTAISQPLALKKVLLSIDNGDTLNYLYSDSTDKDGYFIIPVLASDKNIDFVARYSDSISGYYYTASTKCKAGDANVVLDAVLDESTQNGFAITTLDESGGIIPNVTVRMYGSQQLATLNDTSGIIQTFNSDSYGKFYKLKIPPGLYYFNAIKIVGKNTYQKLFQSETIGVTGIKKDSIVLNLVTTAVTNGFTIKVKDSIGGVIAGASVYIYNSQVLAASNDPNAAIIITKTDSAGFFTKYNYPAGIYFANAAIKVDTIVYQSLMKEINLPANGIVIDSIVVLKKL